MTRSPAALRGQQAASPAPGPAGRAQRDRWQAAPKVPEGRRSRLPDGASGTAVFFCGFPGAGAKLEALGLTAVGR